MSSLHPARPFLRPKRANAMPPIRELEWGAWTCGLTKVEKPRSVLDRRAGGRWRMKEGRMHEQPIAGRSLRHVHRPCHLPPYRMFNMRGKATPVLVLRDSGGSRPSERDPARENLFRRYRCFPPVRWYTQCHTARHEELYPLRRTCAVARQKAKSALSATPPPKSLKLGFLCNCRSEYRVTEVSYI
ncbi:hypothetical protein B0H12DRAFT_1125107 [Mycena haematopus]|nr:hypothetical protein B0H12DRAFT_1125107 [Mycena haematopus]